MIILVCGGREYTNATKVWEILGYNVNVGFDIVVQGGARGADALAQEWCNAVGCACAEVPANWDVFGKSAGPRRNEWMLMLKPELVIAFPGNVGTAHMIELAKKAKIEVLEVEE